MTTCIGRVKWRFLGIKDSHQVILVHFLMENFPSNNQTNFIRKKKYQVFRF